MSKGNKKSIKKTVKANGKKKATKKVVKKNGKQKPAATAGKNPKKNGNPSQKKTVETAREKGEKKPAAEPEKSANTADLSPLKKVVEQTQADLVKAQQEAGGLQKKALELITEAKNSHREALAPYRDACKKAGVECEFSGGRLADVSARVAFIVEKVKDGIKVTVKGRPETAEVIPARELNQSLNKVAYAFTQKHLGPKAEIGNKGGTLSNRLRKVWTS